MVLKPETNYLSPNEKSYEKKVTVKIKLKGKLKGALKTQIKAAIEGNGPQTKLPAICGLFQCQKHQ